MLRDETWIKLFKDKYEIEDWDRINELLLNFRNNLKMFKVLSKFKCDIYDDSIQKFLASFNCNHNKHSFFIMHGAWGSGKTYLMNYLRFLRVAISTIKLRGSKFISPTDWRHIVYEEPDKYKSCKKIQTLFIDDLGMESHKRYKEMIEELIVYRSEQVGLKTFITTNLTNNGIEELFGGRVESRLFDSIESIQLDTGDNDFRKAIIE